MGCAPPSYLTYLLRLWMAEDGSIEWRASLENPLTAERHGFSTLQELITFLQAETSDVAAREAWNRAAGGSGPGSTRQDLPRDEGSTTGSR